MTATAVERLYHAFATDDAETLLATLTPDFHGEVAAGMPLGVAGSYHSAQAMLEGVWGPVAAQLDVTPVPAEYLQAGEDRVVVVGSYRGTVRATGAPVNAAFAHLLRLEGDRVAELIQITDTGRWRDALAS